MEAVQNIKSIGLSSHHLFGDEEEVILLQSEDALLKRKAEWLVFFTEHNSNPFCFYSRTILALEHFFQNHPLIKEQTALEVELSQAFYLRIFELKRPFVFSSDVDAEKLLFLSLIFGKYPGMFRKSVVNYLMRCPLDLRPEIIDDLFVTVLIRFETPMYLVRNFHRLSSQELDLLMHALQGRNMRQHTLFDIVPTKKEFTQLMCLNAPFFDFNNHLVLRGFIFASLVQEEEEDESDSKRPFYVRTYLKASHTFVAHPRKYVKDLAFWKRGFELYCKMLEDGDSTGLADYVDYLEFMLYQSNTSFSLKGRTSESIRRACDQWHNQIHREQQESIIASMKWKKSLHMDLHFSDGTKNYYCKEITTAFELFKEGSDMKNCVSAYAHSCANAICTIWSLRLKTKTSEQTVMTIEVIDQTVVQARIKYNKVPSKKQLNLLRNWTERIGFQLDLYKNE